jgi:protein-tyrosine phosphatase
VFVFGRVVPRRYHVGKNADPTAIRIAQEFGYELSKHVARQVSGTDVSWSDVVLVFDVQNRRRLLELYPNESSGRSIKLLADFLTPPPPEIPDPYKGSDDQFRASFCLIQETCKLAIEALQSSKEP